MSEDIISEVILTEDNGVVKKVLKEGEGETPGAN